MENAIETLEGTNQKIKSLIDQHRLDAGLRVDPLGMVLNGVVDAAVNGGISNYKVRLGGGGVTAGWHTPWANMSGACCK